MGQWYSQPAIEARPPTPEPEIDPEERARIQAEVGMNFHPIIQSKVQNIYFHLPAAVIIRR